MSEPLDGKELGQWEQLATKQDELFRKTFQMNSELQTRVAELEQELSVWKLALTTAKSEKNTLSKTISKLQRTISSLKDDNPLILCLIDGDGCIFSQELLTLGQAGGRQAAQILTKGVTEYMTKETAATGRPHVLASVYLNKQGLQDTLNNWQICTPQLFDAFMNGFNQASPLFQMVDVGNGKEAADAKLREHLRVFVRYPHTLKIFFGGSHDNGYTSTLTSLENEGFLNKIVVLQGYTHIASELQPLDLPTLDIPGLFMAQKLPPNKKAFPPSTPAISPQNLPSDARKPPPSPTKDKSGKGNQSSEKGQVLSFHSVASRTDLSLSSSLTSSLINVNPFQSGTPCFHHYLSKNCRHGKNCLFSHDLELTPKQLATLRQNAKNVPCTYLSQGKPCFDGDKCSRAHVCPRGPQCDFLKAGKCKFTANMHNLQPQDGTGMNNAAPQLPANNPTGMFIQAGSPYGVPAYYPVFPAPYHGGRQ